MKSFSMIDKFIRIQFQIILLCLIAVFSGCDKPQEEMPEMLPEVAYIEVKPEKVNVTAELPGRTYAYLVAEVRPRVNGIIKKRYFEEGSDVKENDVLYELSSETYKAIYDRSVADLAKAEARLISLKLKYERNNILVQKRSVSQQDFELSESEYFAAKAEIESFKAALETARINLGYTKILSPITGRISKSHVTIGSLVTAYDRTPLATIQQIDPIFVNAVQSSADLLKYKRDIESGYITKENDKETKVKLFFEDGTPYNLDGELKFRDITVDQTTGSFILRMIFPNPKLSILPGMYVTAAIDIGVVKDGILIPHQTLKRNFKGEPIVYLIDAQGIVEERKVVIDCSIGSKWLVRDGLKASDKVIVEGFQRIRPGVSAKAVLFEAQNKESAAAPDEQVTSN